MRNIATISGFISIALVITSSCMSDVNVDTNDQKSASYQSLDSETSDTNAMLRQSSEGDLASGRLGFKTEAPPSFSCGGMLGPWPGPPGWWKYGIYNCYPWTMRAQAIKVNGNLGPCLTIAPYQTVYDWVQGYPFGIQGC